MEDRKNSAIDYSSSGMTIQQAMVDHVKRYPQKEGRPDHIIWAGRAVKTVDWWDVPKKGEIVAEILSIKKPIDQGFDIDVEGHLRLSEGEEVPRLRTWADDRYENIVRYPYVGKSGRICIWNVYKMPYPNGQVKEEKWTGNAGFWVENVSYNERIYHCSHGVAVSPDFEALIFKVSILPADALE